MSKGILLLTEMPDCCGECWFCYPAIMNEHEEIYRCFLTGLDAPTTILDDCPLRPLPARKRDRDRPEELTGIEMDILLSGIADGWNWCLNTIEGKYDREDNDETQMDD